MTIIELLCGQYADIEMKQWKRLKKLTFNLGLIKEV